MNCGVIRNRQSGKEDSGEFLGIDVFFIDKVACSSDKVKLNPWGDPLVLPKVVVELENRDDGKYISYCLWKLLCVCSPLRVLICYQPNNEKVKLVKRRLENVIKQVNSTQEVLGNILIIIGNENKKEKDWGEYFYIFGWRNGKLQPLMW